jgi:hypothetical protein
MKALTKEILLLPYQRGAEYNSPDQTADPENRWIWRASVRRLDAESI